jgi:hypothetical protein
MVSMSFWRFKEYSSKFSGGEKMSRVAIDSRKESMRSFLSGFEGIVKIIVLTLSQIISVTFALSGLLNLCYITDGYACCELHQQIRENTVMWCDKFHFHPMGTISYNRCRLHRNVM